MASGVPTFKYNNGVTAPAVGKSAASVYTVAVMSRLIADCDRYRLLGRDGQNRAGEVKGVDPLRFEGQDTCRHNHFSRYIHIAATLGRIQAH